MGEGGTSQKDPTPTSKTPKTTQNQKQKKHETPKWISQGILFPSEKKKKCSKIWLFWALKRTLYVVTMVNFALQFCWPSGNLCF